MRALTKTEEPRYERKALISELTKYEIEALVKLHPAMFSEVYEPRFVNNLYLDAANLEYYYSAVDGLKDRLKVRIRWYGDLFGVIEEPILELKIKNGLLGNKEQFPLIPFSFNDGFRFDEVINVFKKSAIPDELRLELLCLDASLLNRYRRQYFQSADRRYRITIDSDMEFYQVRRHNNSFLHRSVDPTNTVLELKLGPGEAEDAAQIWSFFPFRLTKSSKYVNGLESLQL